MANTDEIEKRMLSGEPFTYGELSREFTPGGVEAHNDASRLVDRTIQKLRRKGLIAFTREGGKVVWRATNQPRGLSAGEAADAASRQHQGDHS
jgi:hypothetical protein